MDTIRSVSRTYASADNARAWRELGATFLIYLAAVVLALQAIGSWWLMLPAMVIAAAAGLRLYMIQHDCLHRSFFTSRALNDAVGTLLSPIAMTPYQATRWKHNQHHAHVSDLDRRDTFEIYVMTVEEWERAPLAERLRYRLYRSPLILVVVGPFLLYAVLRRFPLYGLKTGVWDLVLHNALLLGCLGAVYLAAGWAGIGVFYGIVYIATLCGGLIPYVLHNFEQVHWGVKPELDFETAALEGSSVLDWGWLFDLAMMNIAYHDLHHLNAKIPGYKLKAAHEELERRGLIQSKRIGLIEGLMCLRWKLYDTEAGRMVPFPRRGRDVAGVPAA
ncbi:fatty acid desaturase [Roseivivax sp. GX 12232]|uniref:fatty acid desaturase n=1 Tax=Roseivivax sp. GX 12232 TaxID=2900547 RepID=UPI001E3A39FD|nr:fatty acid desaturase [Roseivivax sp. GX 12232]MCE0505628.1 fatty acid desaturase [Roseivivax sp. GX 12232]